MKNEECGDFSIFLLALVNELERKNNKMDIFVAELLDCTKG